MKPEMIILRHPGRLTSDARQAICADVERLMPGVKGMVLMEGMEAWLLGDDGTVYDLNNSGTLLDGRYRVVNAGEHLEPA